VDRDRRIGRNILRNPPKDGKFRFSTGSHTKELRGKSLFIEHDILLGNGFKSEGKVDLSGTTIGGDLNCKGGEFVGKDGALALDVKGANIQRHVYLCKDDNNAFNAEEEGDHISADQAARRLGISKTSILEKFKKRQLLGWRETKQRAVRFPVW